STMKTLLAAAPADSLFVATLHSDQDLWQLMTGVAAIKLSEADQKAMQDEIRGVLRRRFGIEVKEPRDVLILVRASKTNPKDAEGAGIIAGVTGPSGQHHVLDEEDNVIAT